MRRQLLVLAIAVIGVLGVTAGAFAHIVVTHDNKDCTETTPGEDDVGVNDETASGITTSGSDESVTVTVPEGVTVLHICVKTGSSASAVVNTTVPFVGPGSFTITKTGSGGGISHLEFGISSTPTPTPTPSPTPSPTPEPTPTPTPEPTPTPTPEPTPTPTPEPTPTPSPTPTPTPPPGGGGAGGASGGGGPAAPAGELPFTGLPVLFPLLAGGLLLAAGLGLWRKGRND